MRQITLLAITLCGLTLPVQAFSYQTMDQCLGAKVLTSDENMTVADLKKQCAQELESATVDTSEALVRGRIKQDGKNVLSPFTLMAHRPNYILVGVYNYQGYDATVHNQVFKDDIEYKNYESQFQLSIKFPLLVNLFDSKADIYAAYTNRSFWQVYHEDSSPFRETNHEPEAWIQFHPNWEILGFTNVWNSIGINHQSNGQRDELSRSWNRVFGWFTFERENLAFSIKPWFRISEDSAEDDNPDITDYMGHFELLASYKYQDHVFSFMTRNNLESGFERGAIQLSWSFPLGSYDFLRGYLQWFNGYGESLVSYDQKVNTLGVGLILVDWL
ncbi:MAG: phospholipase A [Desulforhopalus sp.]|nr:phospholipase A [Desulforhopalus sp.]